MEAEKTDTATKYRRPEGRRRRLGKNCQICQIEERRRRNGISKTNNEQERTYGNGLHPGLSKPGGLHERTDLCLPNQSQKQQEPTAFRYRRPGEIQACGDKSRREGSRTENRGHVKGKGEEKVDYDDNDM